MVAILPYTAKLPRTNKGPMVRSQVYQQYAELIETLYTPAARPDGGLQLALAETQSHLLQLCWDDFGISVSGVDADLFSEGVDSLKAIYLRRLIRQQFSWRGISCIAHEEPDQEILPVLGTSALAGNPPGTRSVLLTAATGSVSAHVLFELLNDDSVSTVYCLTRKPSPLKAIRRSLPERGLLRSPEQTSKVVALNGSLTRPGFCLDPFSLSVRILEPAVLMFCSSISTALRGSSAMIQEEPLELDSALMGYGQSKLDCSWLPVDKLASVVLELAESCSAPDRDVGQNRAPSPSEVAYVDDSIYKVYNPRAFPLSELLATLKRSEFQFQTLPFVDWLQLLRESEARGEENVSTRQSN
ncbi:hypothetical protein N7505_007748 [Penicillium chrysogenum]|uniref:Nonribosomal peptide synthetase n=1 Tax=Penicillium chrysogenum TaxID=5076 RepID=A0ABQ8WEY3_PENCH|nr:hypothetical protein N7505_007748 [Penicillium chrysogenum]